MASIKVLIHGVLGKMGMEVLSAICREPGLEPVCGVDKGATESYIQLPNDSGRLPVSRDLENLLITYKPQVMVDFTNAEASIAACKLTDRKSVV